MPSLTYSHPPINPVEQNRSKAPPPSWLSWFQVRLLWLDRPRDSATKKSLAFPSSWPIQASRAPQINPESSNSSRSLESFRTLRSLCWVAVVQSPSRMPLILSHAANEGEWIKSRGVNLRPPPRFVSRANKKRSDDVKPQNNLCGFASPRS